MNDPYQTLGVSRNATDEQIKQAYKELARKYHPDNYANNPLSDLAESKMKEINEAYDAIVKERKGNGNTGSNGSYSGATGEFNDIRMMINNNRLDQAQELLDGVSISKRTAEWYFLNVTVLYKRGWFDDAYTSFSTACRMAPNNMEYRAMLDRLNRQRMGGFNNYGGYNTGTYNNAGGCSTCDICQGLICADCCCECLGGDLIRCC